MKAYVILENPGGELGREEIVIDESKIDDVDAAIDDKATRIIEGWVLSVGDTIRIVEAD